MPARASPATSSAPWPVTSSSWASDLEEVAIEVVARLLSSGGEIVTVIGGADAPDGLAERLGARIERGHRDVEVSVIDGGQPHYPLLLGVE